MALGESGVAAARGPSQRSRRLLQTFTTGIVFDGLHPANFCAMILVQLVKRSRDKGKLPATEGRKVSDLGNQMAGLPNEKRASSTRSLPLSGRSGKRPHGAL